MQTRILALVAVVAGGVLLSTNAQALPSLSIIWQANGTATIGTPTITGSSTIVADIVLSTDPADPLAVNGVFLTIEFDTTELQALSAKELSAVNLPGMGNQFAPITAGTETDNDLGFILSFDQATLATGLIGPETRTLGSVTFRVVNTGPTGDETDIDVIASVQNMGVDGITLKVTPSQTTTGNFIGAAVVPEPAAAVLGMVALGVLLELKRRRS